MSKKYLILAVSIAAMLSMLSACQKKSSEPNYIDTLYLKDLKEAQSALKTFQVVCEDEGNCPEYVGGMASINLVDEYSPERGHHRKPKVGLCSLQLIGPEKILTNRHCLPQYFRRKAVSCADKIQIVFPKTKTKSEVRVGCKSIEDFHIGSDTNLDIPDWAVVQLDRPVERKIVTVNTDGIPNKLMTQVFPVYYEAATLFSKSDNGFVETSKGTIKSVTCRTNRNGFEAFNAYHRHSTNFSAACNNKIVPGNSGAGLIHGDQLLGVVSAAQKSEIGAVSFLGKIFPLNHQYTFGTNAHCISYFNPNPSPVCKTHSSFGDLEIAKTILRLNGVDLKGEKRKTLRNFVGINLGALWNDESPEIANQFFRPKLSDLGGLRLFLKNMAHELWTNTMFPFNPKCLRVPQDSQKSFKFFYPYLNFSMEQAEITTFGQYTVPANLSLLEFDMTYDEKKEMFVGTLPRLSPELLKHLQALDNQIAEARVTCVTSHMEGDCNKLYEVIEARQDLVDSHPDSRHLFSNEELLRSTAIKSPSLSLPACKTIETANSSGV